MLKYTKISALVMTLISSVTIAQPVEHISNTWQQMELSATQQTQAGQANFQLIDDSIYSKLKWHKRLVVPVPLPDGNIAQFLLTYDAIMPEQLANKFPNIRTFKGVDINNPQNVGRFDISPKGFHGMFRYDNQQIFLDPNKDSYLGYTSYSKPTIKSGLDYRKLSPIRYERTAYFESKPQKLNNQNVSRNYTIAITTTGEYSEFHGGTKESVMAALVTMLNRVNQVYQQELDITFNMVSNNDALIFLDSETDPYNNTDRDIDLITDAINEFVSADEYDLGHLVGTGGGGLAGLGVVCSENKAEGLTGSPKPENDVFYIDYVAHEIGHQFGAEHTFNGQLDACGGNRSSTSAYEPGSGNTIMAYAGICGEQNTQMASDPYFHIHSIDQIQDFVTNDFGATCGTTVAQTNAAPIVNAGVDYHIPARTPFTLIGSATDSDGDELSYAWQQYDLGPATSSQADDARDDGQGPLFRAFEPTSQPVRTFPQWQDILNGQQTYGEALPTVDRDLNFRLVVRDMAGNVAYDQSKITVHANDRGFEVISPVNGDIWQTGSNLVTWHTADTELEPISCTNVDITLSTDSGVRFDTVLAEGISNSGSAQVSIGDINSETARIKISCSDNVFFAVSWSDFRINTTVTNSDSVPQLLQQKLLSVNEENSITVAISDLSFNRTVDTVTLSEGNNYTLNGMTVTPDPDYFGTLQVQATASVGNITSDVFTINIVVVNVNDAPVANDDDKSIRFNGSSSSIDVLANDEDADDDVLNIVSFSYDGTGTVEVTDNIIRYTANASFQGTDVIIYTIEDPSGTQSSATLTIEVTNSQLVTEEESSSGGAVSFWTVFFGLLALIRRKKWGVSK